MGLDMGMSRSGFFHGSGHGHEYDIQALVQSMKNVCDKNQTSPFPPLPTRCPRSAPPLCTFSNLRSSPRGGLCAVNVSNPRSALFNPSRPPKTFPECATESHSDWQFPDPSNPNDQAFPDGHSDHDTPTSHQPRQATACIDNDEHKQATKQVCRRRPPTFLRLRASPNFPVARDREPGATRRLAQGK